MEQTSAREGGSSLMLICVHVRVCVSALNPLYFAQVGSLLRITGFPTTISRERALVMATLNLCVKDKRQHRHD